MQIVIDIPKYVYDMAKIHDTIVDADIDKVVTAIKKGMPLPKGHGDLKDVSKIDYQKGVFLDSDGQPMPIIHKIATIEMIRDWLPTIIEMEKNE